MFIFFLVLALLLRLKMALGGTDMVWPDEHFQTLEAAFYRVNGFGFLTWEYLEQYRSWWVSVPFLPIFYVTKFLKIEGIKLILIVQCYMVALEVIAYWFFWNFLKQIELSKIKREMIMVAIVLSPVGIWWSVATLQDRLAEITLLIILPFVFNLLRNKTARSFFVAGFLFTLPLLFKFQYCFSWMGILFIILFVYKLRSTLCFGLGILPSLILIGAMDYLTYGKWWASLLNQIRKGNEIAKGFGVQETPFYIVRLEELMEPLIWGLLTLSIILSFFNKWQPKKSSLENPWLWLIPFIISLGAHTFIDHKETRYLLPSIPFLWIALAYFWKIINLNLKRTVRLKRGVLVIFSGYAVYSHLVTDVRKTSFSLVNTAPVEEAIRLDLRKDPGPLLCVVLHDFHWSQTRGKMVIHQDFEYVQVQKDTSGPDIGNCSYAIIRNSDFEVQRSFYKDWSPIFHSDINILAIKRNRGPSQF